MNTLKIGKFPGEIKEYCVSEGITVRDALSLAGIEIGDEMEVKLDGSAVSMDKTINNGNLLLVTKRLKGQF